MLTTPKHGEHLQVMARTRGMVCKPNPIPHQKNRELVFSQTELQIEKAFFMIPDFSHVCNRTGFISKRRQSKPFDAQIRAMDALFFIQGALA